jgi:hypothetical protein
MDIEAAERHPHAGDRAKVPFTLEQLCRALAAHVLLSTHPDHLHTFLAPEIAERTADFIHRFAMGELVSRPLPIRNEDN